MQSVNRGVSRRSTPEPSAMNEFGYSATSRSIGRTLVSPFAGVHMWFFGSS